MQQREEIPAAAASCCSARLPREPHLAHRLVFAFCAVDVIQQLPLVQVCNYALQLCSRPFLLECVKEDAKQLLRKEKLVVESGSKMAPSVMKKTP